MTSSAGIGQRPNQHSTQQPFTPPPAARPETDQDSQLQNLLQQMGLRKAQDGTVVWDDTTLTAQAAAETKSARGVDGANTSRMAAAQLYGTGDTRVPPPSVRTAPMTDIERQGAESFMADTQQIFGEAFTKPDGTPKQPGDVSGDLALAALKLRIMNSLNDPQTLNKLMDANDSLSETATERSRIETTKAQEKMEKAAEYAEKMKVVSAVVSAAMIVASIAITAVTMGAGAAAIVGAAALAGGLIGAAAGGKDGAMTGASVGAAVGSLGVSVGASMIAASAQTAAQQATQQALSQASKAAGQEFSEEAVKKMSEEAVKSAVKELPKECGKEAAQKTLTQKVTKQLVQQGVPEQTAQTIAKDTVASMPQESFGNLAKAGDLTARGNTFGNAKKGLSAAAAGKGGMDAAAQKHHENLALQSQMHQLRAEVARKMAEQAQESNESATEFMRMIMQMVNESFDNAIQSVSAKGATANKLLAAGFAS